MPITQSAKKAMRSSARKRVSNLIRKDAMKEAVKSYRALIAAKKMDDAKKALPGLYQAIDKAAKKGVIKPNTASRRKSRLSRLIVS
ncbi:MAG TPA: 30S ribosomal protein S20 [Candidatus Paceibacterota bacterium]